jgi:predicted enzyme related to lactoylglutathione lyase
VSNDCAQELGRVVAAGGVVVQPKQSIGEYGFMGLFKDSEGNTIGVHSIK